MKNYNFFKRTFFTLLLVGSLTINAVSASYLILRFSGGSDDVNNINKYSSSVKKTSDSLVNLSNILVKTKDDLVQTKDDSALSTSFLNSFLKNVTDTDSNPLNQISDPPYGNTGQIYWDTTNNTLISTNGTNRYVWVGSSWMSINSTNLITGTNQNVSRLMALSHDKIPTTDLGINSFGEINTDVRISDVTANWSFHSLSPEINVKPQYTTISNISWDKAHHCLTGKTSSGLQVVYSVYPDDNFSYWSDAILK
ncbi:hypothetical protein [Leuconostoc mesenteroides]|uniref:hypothetical protein n=1 Tax=Leuconostoc mesenteroides TaxID=1245 RepID=UPI0023602850|nr:hypothetical protein [Leuconostoc mesenteroides]